MTTYTGILSGLCKGVVDISVSDSGTSLKITAKSVTTTVYADESKRVAHELHVGSTQVFSKSVSRKEGSERTSVNKSITIPRRESQQTVSVRYEVSCDGYDVEAAGTLTISALTYAQLTPTWKVSGLKAKERVKGQDGATSTGGTVATWKVPRNATDTKNVNHFDGEEIKWTLACLDPSGRQSRIVDTELSGNEADERNGQGWQDYPDVSKTGREAFYPLTSLYVKSATVEVRGYHRHSVTNQRIPGPMAMTTFQYLEPRKPEVEWSYDESNGHVTLTVKSDAGIDRRERYDTSILALVTKQDGRTETLLGWKKTKKTEYTYEKDVSPYLAGMSAGKGILLSVQAYARGVRGDSDMATATMRIGMPKAVVIKGVTATKKTKGGVINVSIATGKFAESFIKVVRLERRMGESGNWEQVGGAVGDNGRQSLYDQWGDGWPEGQVLGQHVYYRVRSENENFHTYSAVFDALELFAPKPKIECNSKIEIVNVTPNADGTAAQVVVGFTDSTPNTGVELTWSDRATAWNDNKGPEKWKVEREDARSKSSRHAKTLTLDLVGLSPGTTYYLHARRYRVAEDEEHYSGYSARWTLVSPSAEGTTCVIVERTIVASRNGTEASFDVSYSGPVATTGTELSYSEVPHAWEKAGAQVTTVYTQAAGKSGPLFGKGK